MALKPVTEEFIDELKLGLSPEAVLAVPDDYLSEPRSRWRGISSVLVLPQNVNEVSTVVGLANARNIPIIPYGGGTGLPTQQECLNLLGCNGKGKVNKLAEIIGATVLAGELSLMSAVLAGDWVTSHDALGRNR